jgi:hypothetical protein
MTALHDTDDLTAPLATWLTTEMLPVVEIDADMRHVTSTNRERE